MVKGSKGVRKGAFVVALHRSDDRAKDHGSDTFDPTIHCANKFLDECIAISLL
jgi:hypothetical protein